MLVGCPSSALVRPSCLIVLLAAVSSLLGACGGSDDSDSADNVGGGLGMGGSSAGTGGTGGVSGAALSYWPAATYTPGSPVPATGYHSATVEPIPVGSACLGACHGPTGTAVTKLAFGGVVYAADGVTPAAGVEVGVKDGTNSIFVYSATNGMYWSTSTATINWPAADIRIRNAAGEVPKLQSDDRNGDCDSCHFGALLSLKAL